MINFFFSHNVFYLCEEFSEITIKSNIVTKKNFQFWSILNL